MDNDVQREPERHSEARGLDATFRSEPSRLIATAVHDLRSPLTVILSLSEFIASDPTMDAGTIAEFARSIGAKAAEMQRLLETLTEVNNSTPAVLRREDVAVDALMLSITAPYDGRDRWTPSIDLDVADAPATWPLDPDRARCAIIALIDWASGSDRSLLSVRHRDEMLEVALREYGRTVGSEQLADIDRALHGAEPAQGVGLMLDLTLAGMIAAEHGGTGGARTLSDGFEVWVRFGR